MPVIKRITLQRLRNAGYINLLTDAKTIITGSTAVNTAVAEERQHLADIITRLNALFVTDPASALTDDVVALDADRDHLLTGLRMRCAADAYHPDPAVRAAAATLSRSLDIYGADVTKQAMNDETTSIANILTDWTTKPELIAGAAQLGLSAWTSALATANEAFRVKYLQRTNEMAAATTPENIKALRLEGNKAWYDLMEMITANYTLAKGAGAWGIVVPQLNTLIDQYNATLAARAGRADAAKSGGGTPAPEA